MINKSLNNSQQKNYCRICLQHTQPLKKLPCACKGSLSYMHDKCINMMLQIKIQNQKQDVPDYIQVFYSQYSTEEAVKAKCQICLHEIHLERQSKLNLQKLAQIQMEIYIVLFGISCLSVLGWNIAMILLEKAIQESAFVLKVLYLGAYFWIIGVILYVMLQPLYSQIKVTVFKIKITTSSPRIEKYSEKQTNCKYKQTFMYYYDKIEYYIQKILKIFRKKQRNFQRNMFDKKNGYRSHSRPRCKDRSTNNKQYAGRVSFQSGKILYFQV